MTNVFIDYGLCDWEVKQQKNGFADFTVGGRYEVSDVALENTGTAAPVTVMVRIVNEYTDEPVTEWTTAKTENGKWEIDFRTVPCGGPYRLSTVLKCHNEGDFWVERNPSGNNIHHFCVGDVYVIAGQSNAIGTGRGIISDPPEIGIHVFRDCEKWDLATNPFYSKRGFHGPFLSFARYLKHSLGYPIGLIPCALGSSALNEWVDDRCYTEMIDTIKLNGIVLKGVLWYQGCSDAAWGNQSDPDMYFEKFKLFTENLRNDLKQKDLPIITFQLNRHTDDFEDNDMTDAAYDKVRNAQRLAAKKLESVFIVPTVDSGKLTDGIHNSRSANILLGERAALIALNKIYHRGLDFSAPDIEMAYLKYPHGIVLEFSHVADCLMAFHVAPRDLPIAVADEDGNNDILAYRIDKNKIYLELERATEGVCKIKCQFGKNPKGYIQDIGRQIPVLCFSDVIVEVA